MKASKSISRIWVYSLEITICLIAGIIATSVFAAQVTLAWDPNSESDLAGYRIHYGTASGSYSVHIDVHNVTTYTVTGLTNGQTYYLAATAYDSAGNESGYSNQVNYTVPTATNGVPSAPATPSGPTSAVVNVAVTFSTSATDPNGDSLEYRYDWSGGVLSNWAAASQSHSWSTAGQYVVKAQARDSQGAESAWSQAKTVTITQSSAPLAVDSDGDGVPDSQDAFPNDPKEWADANRNGIGDNADAAASKNKQAPDGPVLISPVNDAVVNAMAELKTGAFHTAVAGTTHAKTRWQVFSDEDDVCVLDIQSTTALTSLTVPKLVLDEGTPYFWRAQFIDSKGAASAWSDDEYFSTQTTDRDRNANGIPDTQEVARTVDLNLDRVKDYRQTSIKSVKMEGTNVQIGVSIKDAPAALAIESVESENPNQLDASAAGKPNSLPFGLIDFKIAVAKPGDRATVTLYFSEAAPSGSRWYMFDTVASVWADFSTYANFASDRRSVVLTLADGGPGDADGIANGVIVDPGGVGVSNDNVIQPSRRRR
jgi:chitinase